MTHSIESRLSGLRAHRHAQIESRVVARIARGIRVHAHGAREILELDAGDGRRTLRFRAQLSRPASPWIYGRRDVRAPEVRNQSRFASVDFERERFPTRDDMFDIVVWHQELATLKEISLPLAEIARVLRRDGLFVLSLPNLAALHNRLLLLAGRQPTTLHIARGDHVRGFAFRSMTGVLRDVGWHVVSTDGIGLPPVATGVMPAPLRHLSHTAIWLLRPAVEVTPASGSSTSGAAGTLREIPEP